MFWDQPEGPECRVWTEVFLIRAEPLMSVKRLVLYQGHPWLVLLLAQFQWMLQWMQFVSSHSQLTFWFFR